jgi:general secretion pathway protein G
MRTRRTYRRSARAFTIAEIIVVVVIIGVLAAIIAPRLLSRVTQARTTTAGANAGTVANAVEAYMADCGPPPAGVPMSQFLFQRPTDQAIADKWQGPYLKNTSQLLDPWNKEYMLVMPGQKNADFDIVSYGADGQPGGDGENKDIVKP